MAKLRHDCCGGVNCYLDRYHADISDFDEDLPSSCEYTDIDAFVEYGRHYLISEFKTEVSEKIEDHWAAGRRRRPNGQMIALEKLTEDLPKSTVWLIEGDAPRRQCTRMRECVSGVWSDWKPINWQGLKKLHKSWLKDSHGRSAAKREALRNTIQAA